MVETVLLLAIVVALAAWGVSSIKGARRGRIVPPRCSDCGKLVTRARRYCRHCGAELG